MKNDISHDVLIAHLRARRAALAYELAEIEKRATEIRGAIQETATLEQQTANGMLSKTRLSCE